MPHAAVFAIFSVRTGKYQYVVGSSVPERTGRSHSAGLMLGRRAKRRPNIKPAERERLVGVGD